MSDYKFEDSGLWRLKLKLQFNGWLQYFPNSVAIAVCLLLAGIGALVGVMPGLLVWTPLGLAAVLSIVMAFDLVTVKFRLRPTEPLPERRDGVDPFELMANRRSCRSFQTRMLTDAHRAELLASVHEWTAPARLVGTRPIRLEYVAAPLTVWPVVNAGEFLVAIAPKEYDALAVIDVGRSLQRVVLHATRMGLGTCWIGPGADQASVASRLGDRFDPERDHIICVCAVGYESWFKPTLIRVMAVGQHRRLPLEGLFFADSALERPLDLTQPPFAAFGPCYEACRWSPSSYNAQPTRCVGLVDADPQGAQRLRFDFVASTLSRYYAPVALGIWCADWQVGCEALGIKGHFTVLSPEERGVEPGAEPPRYGLSWVAEG